MRKREHTYSEDERYKDLNKAYKKAWELGSYTTEEEAMAIAITLPSKRFWVSEERLMDVINAFERGKDPRVYRNPKREMYRELYRRYLAYKEEYPEQSKLDICTTLVYQEAPKQYIKLSYALRLFHKGRSKHKRHHHLRNENEA